MIVHKSEWKALWVTACSGPLGFLCKPVASRYWAKVTCKRCLKKKPRSGGKRE